MALSLDLSGRLALVTGGTRGVGLGIARSFAAAGATVVVCSRSSGAAPIGIEHRVCDVREPDSVDALVDGILADHGRLDILVNNAGGAPYARAAQASPHFHEKVVGLNLLAPLLVGQAAYRAMCASGGSIVNISSVSALRPAPGAAAYGAAKAGLDSLTRTLAVEWAPTVRVNGIDVGMVATEETSEPDGYYGGPEGLAAIEATVPLRRLATPAEVGALAVFLASDLAGYVTGSTIQLHGGGETPAFLTALAGLQHSDARRNDG